MASRRIGDYTYDSTRGLTDTLRMAAPEGTGSLAGKLVDFQVTGFDPAFAYKLNLKGLRKLYLGGVSHTNLALLWGAFELDRERLIPGWKDSGVMHFTGLLDQSVVGTPVTFDFTILDEKNRIAYTRSVGPKTVNGNLSVDLGDISDRSKWKATPYEDLGGAWRIPTSDEWRRLWDNTKHGFTQQSSVHYARGVSSKVSGFTDKYIYLPQVGYVHFQKLTGIVDGFCDVRIYYWTSDYADFYNGGHRAFWFNVNGTSNPDFWQFIFAPCCSRNYTDGVMSTRQPPSLSRASM